MSDLRRSAGVGALSLLVSLLGCGASSGGSDAGNVSPPATCGTVNPCGGDLTGTWKVLGGCSDALYWEGILSCPPNTPEELLGSGYTGTVTFNSDMTYSTMNLVGTAGGNFTIPSACIPGGVSCAQITPYCSGGSTCTCPVPGAGASIIAGSGTYSVTGSQLTFSQAANSTIQGITYCVAGGLLHLETNVTVIQSSGPPTTRITSDLVAEKQ